MLFEKDSTLDLVCRGYNREYILKKNGEDVGYHSSHVTNKLINIDRKAYKIEFVLENLTDDELKSLINQYANGLSKKDVFEKFGLAYNNDKGISLKAIFESAGLLNEFKEADKAARIKSMKSGKISGAKTNHKKTKEGVQKTADILGAGGTKSQTVKPDMKQPKRNKTPFNVFDGFGEDVEKYALHQMKSFVHKYNNASSDDVLKKVILIHFGEENVEFGPTLNPDINIKCFAYIKSLNCYIDFYSGEKHGYHFFDVSREIDRVSLEDKQNRLDSLKNRNNSNEDTDYLEEIIDTWTVSDVIKRSFMKKNNLNYVVFWDEKLDDARLWFNMDCPVGQDWKKEYSWLPERTLEYESSWPELKKGISAAQRAAKAANWREFYKNELRMWEENKVYPKKWGTLQARLYANRFKYQASGMISENHQYYNGKLPVETERKDMILSKEILRGFRIGAFMEKMLGYTSFNVKLMQEVINEFKPESIYDPCMGWGERCFTTLANNIKYTGIDINKNVCMGNKKITEHYGVLSDAASIICGDSAEIVNDSSDNNAEMILTCPPYLDIELYNPDNPKSAENMPEDEFERWFEKVIVNAINDKTKVIAIQTNQECKPIFMKVLENLGYKFNKELTLEKQISHMHRSADGITKTKKEFESMIVYEVK